MLKVFLHTTPVKSTVEEILNCWLSYTFSQPMHFDLAILVVFLLEYLGISQTKRIVLLIFLYVQTMNLLRWKKSDSESDDYSNDTFELHPNPLEVRELNDAA